MKLFKKYLIYTVFLLCAPSLSFTQAIANNINCRSINAKIDNWHSFNSQNQDTLFLVKLEKELIEGVWTSIQSKKSQKSNIVFTDLPDGLYRVTFIPYRLNSLTNTVINNQNLQEKIHSQTNVFISNSIRITSNNNNCIPDRIFNSIAQLPNLHIFPNPSKGTFTLQKHSSHNQIIDIYNLTGRLIQSFTLGAYQQSKVIKITQTGLYLIRLKDQDGLSQTLKVTILE